MFLWRKAEVVFALCVVLLMRVFQFRVLRIWIPRYLAVSVVWGNLVVRYGVVGLDYVTFVGDVHDLATWRGNLNGWQIEIGVQLLIKVYIPTA